MANIRLPCYTSLSPGGRGYGVQAEQEHLKHSAAKLASRRSRKGCCKARRSALCVNGHLTLPARFGAALAKKSSRLTGQHGQISALSSGYCCVGPISSLIFLVSVSIERDKDIFWVIWKILVGFSSSEVARAMCLSHPLVGILRHYQTFHLQYHTWGKEIFF